MNFSLSSLIRCASKGLYTLIFKFILARPLWQNYKGSSEEKMPPDMFSWLPFGGSFMSSYLVSWYASYHSILCSEYELDWLRCPRDTFKKCKVFKNCIFPGTPQLCWTAASKWMAKFSWNMRQSSWKHFYFDNNKQYRVENFGCAYALHLRNSLLKSYLNRQMAAQHPDGFLKSRFFDGTDVRWKYKRDKKLYGTT